MVLSFLLAQENVAPMLAPLTDPVMAGFGARPAESSPGFAWRITSAVNPFETGILFYPALWESPDALKQFICRTSHKQLLAAREAWFRRFDGHNVARWWIPARARLEYLREHDDSPYPFRFPSKFTKAAVA